MSSRSLLVLSSSVFSNNVPLAVPNLTLWLDASDSSTITESGGSVSQWDDKSSGNNDAAQGTGANQPTTNSRTIGGVNAIDFDGTDDFMTIAAAAGIDNMFDTGGTIFIVTAPDSDGGGNFGRLYDKTTAGTFLLLQGDTGSVVQPRFVAGFDSTDGDWKTTAASVDIGAGNIITITYDGSNVSNNPTFMINEVSEAITEDAAPVGTIDDDSAAALTIGNNAGGTRGLEGLIGEVLFYNRTLTAGEITQVEAYLSSKWSI